MKQIKLLTSLLLLSTAMLTAQKNEKSEPKIVLITIDGLRWQELFLGADPFLITNKGYVDNTIELKELFWRKKTNKRREVLMPFIWNQVSKMGQIHGNRTVGSKMDLTNTMCFSYPGYNEILTGRADDININSNAKINNPNKTVLEIVNELPEYKGGVVAFGSWDVFPFIIDEENSNIPVNAGFENARGNDLTDREKFLNELQTKIPSPWSSVRLDAFTHFYALEYMKKRHPKFVYIAYGETDDFAHDGDYQAYLKSAHNTDKMIKELWDFTQQEAFYKDNTIFIITTDHGRGTKPLVHWKSHGSDIKGSGEVWMISFGRNIKILGEITNNEHLYSNQIAPTILEILNIKKDSNVMKGSSLGLFAK